VPTPAGPSELDRPLTPGGVSAAASLAPELAALGAGRVVSSPYLRAVQTVRPAADALGVPVETDPELREWDSGLRPRPDFARLHEESWADPALTRSGGESLAQLSARAVVALRRLLDGPDVLVGSHGTFVSRALVGFGCPVGWAFARAMPMPAVYVLSFASSVPEISGPGLGGT
jgi:2,3-bisphosphoglycerate-dependent phosphoglycerate mutase